MSDLISEGVRTPDEESARYEWSEGDRLCCGIIQGGARYSLNVSQEPLESNSQNQRHWSILNYRKQVETQFESRANICCKKGERLETSWHE